MTVMPKYMVLVNWVKEKISSRELKSGDKLFSENELSSMFAFSRQTVRQAINILVQENLLESRQGSGTFVTGTLKSGRKPSMVVGVITTYVGAYIFPSIIKGIETVLTKNGYSMQLAFTHNKIENERKALTAMLEKGVDGIIVEPAKSGLPNPNEELYQRIMDEKIPTLFINGYYPRLALPHVALDDRMTGFSAANCLIQAGHRDIYGIFKLDDYQGHLRYAGFLKALMEAGIQICDDRVLWYSTEDFENLTGASFNLVQRIGGCSGVVCYNDELAIKLVELFKQSGITVPQQKSIVSVDNSALAELCEIPLTSVAHPMELLGSTAAKNILGLIYNADFHAEMEFPPHLVERESVWRQ